MRVITGSARGRRLASPEGLDVRPTSDRVKEAIFSIVQFEIEGRKVLDLFAGSAQLGIEALSRGAEQCVFVEQKNTVAEIVKKNITTVGFTDKSKIVNSDAFSYIKTTSEKFDLAFLDPPYEGNLIAKALPDLVLRMNEGSVIVCESDSAATLPMSEGNFRISRQYRYSSTMITVYRDSDEKQE